MADTRRHPLAKTQWCDFVWRSHGCRYGSECWYAHDIADYRGPRDKYIQQAIDRGIISSYKQPPFASVSTRSTAGNKDGEGEGEGYKGIKGDKGGKGEGTGVRGDKGIKGKGFKGDKGIKGDNGIKGKGDKGGEGEGKGFKGDTGITGKGDKGGEGEGKGFKGPPGIPQVDRDAGTKPHPPEARADCDSPGPPPNPPPLEARAAGPEARADCAPPEHPPEPPTTGSAGCWYEDALWEGKGGEGEGEGCQGDTGSTGKGDEGGEGEGKGFKGLPGIPQVDWAAGTNPPTLQGLRWCVVNLPPLDAGANPPPSRKCFLSRPPRRC